MMTILHKTTVCQYFTFYSHSIPCCGKLWKNTISGNNCGLLGKLTIGYLKVHETRTLVTWQREDGGVHVGVHMLLAKLLIQALHGTFRSVVVLTEVAQHDVFHARMIHLGHKPSRLIVAQMSEWPRDALFQEIWIGAFLQHFHIVIGFNDEIVRAADLFSHYLVKHADVGGDGQCMFFIIKMITHRPSPIVHHGEGLYRDTTHLERLHGLYSAEKPCVNTLGGIAFNKSLQTIGMGIYGDGGGFAERLQTPHMVDMVMGDENGFDVADVQVVLCQPRNDLLRAGSRIDKHAFVLFAHIIAIAAAARGKAAKDERRKAGEKIHSGDFGVQSYGKRAMVCAFAENFVTNRTKHQKPLPKICYFKFNMESY